MKGELSSCSDLFCWYVHMELNLISITRIPRETVIHHKHNKNNKLNETVWSKCKCSAFLKLNKACLFCLICSQVPVNASNTTDRELPGAASLSANVNLGLLHGEGDEGHANQVATAAPASEGSASLGEPEEDGNQSHHSHSTASSQCSATYSNLGKSESCFFFTFVL